MKVHPWQDRQRRRGTRKLPVDDQAVQLASVPDGATLFEEEEYRQHVVNRALKIMQAVFQTHHVASMLVVITKKMPHDCSKVLQEQPSRQLANIIADLTEGPGS